MHYQETDVANNLMALTGPIPSPEEMQAALPEGLKQVGLQCPWNDGSELFELLAEEQRNPKVTHS